MRYGLVALVVVVLARVASAEEHFDRHHLAEQVSDVIDELARIERAAESCDNVHDRLAELRGRLKALRDDLRDGEPPPNDGPKAITDAAFMRLVKRVEDEKFSDAKLRVIREAGASNFFHARQIAKLVSGITMGSDKLKALGTLAPKLLDANNAFEIYKVFEFDTDKKKAEEILSKARER